MRRALLLALLMLAACSHDLGALRARGPVDGGPDVGGPFETAPTVVSEEPVVTDSITCTLDGISERGGDLAGLGRGADTETVTVDRRMVTACLRADFVSALPTESALVVARQTMGACGDACTTECGTAPEVHVFAGDTRSYRHIGTFTPGPELADQTFTVADTIRYILVCRGSQAATHDDVEVDYVALLR